MSLQIIFAADFAYPEKFDVVAWTNLNGDYAAMPWLLRWAGLTLRQEPILLLETGYAICFIFMDGARYSGSNKG